MKTLLKSREEELGFFEVYLEDRLRYSFELGLIDKIPTNPNEILEVGDEITFRDIEKLLKERAEKIEREDVYVRLDGIGTTGENGNKILFVNPDLLEEERGMYEREGYKVVSAEDAPPLIRGELLEESLAEHYPTIRWNFEWKNYVVIGVPDGITDKFVYEFKTTRNRFLMYYIKPVAFAQADLYGFFFKRPKKRVQIYIMEDGVTKTWEEEVKKGEAINLLERFKRVDEGEIPIPPKKWKCKKCYLRERCRIGRTHHLEPLEEL